MARRSPWHTNSQRQLIFFYFLHQLTSAREREIEMIESRRPCAGLLTCYVDGVTLSSRHAFTTASTLDTEKNVSQDPQVLTPSEVLGENLVEIFFRLRRPNFACAFSVKFYVERNPPHLPIRPESRERAVQSADFRIFSLSASTLCGSIAPLPGPPTPDLMLSSSSASKNYPR